MSLDDEFRVEQRNTKAVSFPFSDKCQKKSSCSVHWRKKGANSHLNPTTLIKKTHLTISEFVLVGEEEKFASCDAVIKIGCCFGGH